MCFENQQIWEFFHGIINEVVSEILKLLSLYEIFNCTIAFLNKIDNNLVTRDIICLIILKKIYTSLFL